MGLTSGLLTRSVENPLLPLTSTALLEVLGGKPTKTGISVNERTAVKFIAIYRAVSIVSGVIASLPLQGKRGYEHVNTRLLADPHPDMSPFEVWERMLWAQLLNGNSYSAKIRDRSGAITYLDPFELGDVEARRVKRTPRNPWGKEFDVRTGNTGEWPKVVTPEDVLHIPGPGYDGATGLSPIGVAREGIGVGLAAEEVGARFFGSGSILGSGVLQTDAKIDQPTADTLKARWKAKMTGLGNAHEIAVLDAGAKYVPLGLSPVDAQFIETRMHQVGEAARLYGIPPHLLGDLSKSTSWGTGIEQQTLGLIIFTLTPWMSRMEGRISKECLPRGVTADFDEAELLKGDFKARTETAGGLVEKGIARFNEARQRVGLAPITGGELRAFPANFSLLGDDGMPVSIGTGSNEPTDQPDDEPAPADDVDQDDDEDEETDE